MEYVSYFFALPELDRVRGQARWGQGFGEPLGGRGAGPSSFPYAKRDGHERDSFPGMRSTALSWFVPHLLTAGILGHLSACNLFMLDYALCLPVLCPWFSP